MGLHIVMQSFPGADRMDNAYRDCGR